MGLPGHQPPKDQAHPACTEPAAIYKPKPGGAKWLRPRQLRPPPPLPLHPQLPSPSTASAFLPSTASNLLRPTWPWTTHRPLTVIPTPTTTFGGPHLLVPGAHPSVLPGAAPSLGPGHPGCPAAFPQFSVPLCTWKGSSRGHHRALLLGPAGPPWWTCRVKRVGPSQLWLTLGYTQGGWQNPVRDPVWASGPCVVQTWRDSEHGPGTPQQAPKPGSR